MGDFLQVLAFVIIGVALLWFGFTMLMGHLAKRRLDAASRPLPQKDPTDPQSCPICSSILKKGQLVKTLAFPSITGGKDRLMHIRGCIYCINGSLERKCPVCGISLDISDVLIARIFERPNRKPHVHITGCNKCRRTGKL